MNIYLLAPVIVMAVNLLLAELVLFHHRQNRNRYITTYAAFALTLAVWSFGLLLTVMADSEGVAFLGDSISGVALVLVPALALIFAGQISGIRWANESAWPASLAAMLAVIFAVLAATGKLIDGLERTNWGWWPVPGPGFLPMAIVASVCMTAAGVIMTRRLVWGVTSRLRLQSAILIAAIMFPVFTGLGTDLVLRLLKIPSYPMTVFYTTLSAIGMAYALLKFRFLDVTPTLAADTIADSMVEYLIMTDDRHRIRYANPSALRALCKEWKDVEGEDIADFISDADTLLEDERVPTYGARTYLTSDMRYSPLSVNVSRFISESLSGKILVMRDVSETEKLIEELKESTEELKLREAEFEHMNNMSIEREKEIAETRRKIDELKRKRKR